MHAVKNMTVEEQRIAIAGWMGWRFVENKSTGGIWIPPNAKCLDLPNYPSDLNAMHKAEKKLTKAFRLKYIYELVYVTKAECLEVYTEAFVLAHATASQRSEALCRILWPERWTAMKGEV